ncbi:MAG: FkbM family methyltransferase [Betaproteobacteria bacterium]|nr:FkbM family methyltransferase [Betaproteobacteria bacterium]
MSIFRLLLWPLRGRRAAAEAGPLPPADPASQVEDTIERIVTVRDGATEVAYCTPNRFSRWRVDTLFDKEPDTIEWIRSFAPEDVLVDIGANVGMYSVWAARTRGARVYAFEPEAQNFALLNKNILVNGLGGKVTAYCVALSDSADFSLLYVSGFTQGGSGHTFGADLDHHLRPRVSPFAQGCVSTTLDALVASGALPVPTHIKIDVDGLEHRVLAGCSSTLRDPRVKSVLVEINSGLEEHRRIVGDLTALGFAFSEEQVRGARRTAGPATGVGNYVFRR